MRGGRWRDVRLRGGFMGVDIAFLGRCMGVEGEGDW